MKKWNLIIDVEKCEDCNNCFISCKDEHVGNEWSGYNMPQSLHGQRWVNIMRKERGQYPLIDVAYLPVPCMHCDNAPCIKASKNNAAYKREDGIVIIDPQKARGQTNIMNACPYNAIYWNEELEIPQKCTLCAHLLDDGWEKTRCVQACPTGAMRIYHVEDSDMNKIIKRDNLEILHPEYNTLPRVYYRNLFRFEKCFISGSVASEKDGIVDCVKGAEVKLLKDSIKIAESETDNFGDFKFDHLNENSGSYKIEIRHENKPIKTIEVFLKASLNTGTIYI